MKTLNHKTPKEAAKEYSANWRKFDSFAYFGEDTLDGSIADWCIVYTHNRDSGILAESNASVINREMLPFVESGDARPETHSHWACGSVHGYALRVYKDSEQSDELTDAFRKWCELQAQIDDYPVLDEEDWSNREYEATLENLRFELRFMGSDETHAESVFDWLRQSPEHQHETECLDDQGAYPSTESIKAALEGLSK
jgi:hypothetical protein